MKNSNGIIRNRTHDLPSCSVCGSTNCITAYPNIYIYIYIYIWTTCSRALFEKVTVLQLVKKFPAFYGTWSSITAFTTAHNLFLYRARSIQSTPHPIYWISLLILSSHLRLGRPSGFSNSVPPTKTLYAPLLTPIRATCSAHHVILDFITRIIFGRSVPTNRYAPHCAVFSSTQLHSYLSPPKIFLNALFPNILYIRSFINVTEQVSRPYKTTGIIHTHTHTFSSVSPSTVLPALHLFLAVSHSIFPMRATYRPISSDSISSPHERVMSIIFFPETLQICEEPLTYLYSDDFTCNIRPEAVSFLKLRVSDAIALTYR